MFKGLGSGENGEFTFLDVLSVISFIIGIENLKYNISQDDIQKQTVHIDASVNEQVDRALQEIQKHLKEQDRKINMLLERSGTGNENG